MYPELEDRRLIYEIIRRMIGTVVTDLIEETRRNIEQLAPATIDDVRDAGKPLVSMSAPVYEQHVALKRFLNRHLYRHEKKIAMEQKVQLIIEELFAAYMDEVGLMPPEFADAAADLDKPGRARIVADYVAGMTDRYAIAAHERITG